MDASLSKEIKKCLRDVFKFKYFKSKEQFNAIKTVLTEKFDVLINLPPAAGKSLCFQLPAVLCKNKVAIIFVENINTLEEHVQFLENVGIDVRYFHTKLCKSKQENLFDQLTHQVTSQFIYVTIATFTSPLYKTLFQTLISNLYENKLISMFVVDEAHCASDKTIDYIKSYNEIITIRNNFPNVRLIALTSIGTEIINNDIKTSLGMLNTVEYNGNYKWIRPNIYIEVKFKDLIKDPFKDVVELINNFIEAMECFSGIILCRKYEETVEVAKELSQRGIPTVPYYSKMKNHDQEKNKEIWMTGEAVMIAATHVSAINLNKSNVGCVIHWSLPLTMEQYYRDIGKAGRLGGNALSRIYFGIEDWTNAQFSMMNMSSYLFSEFENVINFCIADKCKHVLYSENFGFNAEPCKISCDACEGQSDYKKSLEKFKIYDQQHRLLPQIVNLPITRIYNPKKNLTETQFNVRWNSRYLKYSQIGEALIENYRKAQNKFTNNIEDKNLWRLARNLEYIAFSTHDSQEYHMKIRSLLQLIKKNTKLSTLSNYIINYKFKNKKT